jgi:protein involved in polysaccharide export with SLBB domain
LYKHAAHLISMLKINCRIVAMALAVISIPASAQESTSKSDMFEQGASTYGSAPMAASARRVIISNTSGDEFARAGGLAGQQEQAGGAVLPRNGKDQLGRSALLNQNRGFDVQKPPSEFQKFIFDSTGQMLPNFGAEFFVNAPSTFAPVLNSPVQADYSLGPGDQLTIRGWGSIDIDYRATIDRNGTITLPTIGTIVLAGVKAGDAEKVVRAAVGKYYKGVTISVNFGQLRAITVYVVGQANKPGTYTVSSLSTLVTALFASGGPNANGSMRRVQVKRGGKVAAELDLYAFLAKGDKSADIKLQDGDTIFIPSAAGFVALIGKVNTPAIYELKSNNDSVGSVLDFAGGLPVVADPRRAFLERIDPSKSHPRSVEQFALDSEGLKRSLKNGDLLNITSVTPDFSNAVILRGNVDQPVRAPFTPGMRISDLIPNREYLITRKSTLRQNNVLAEDEITKEERETRRANESAYPNGRPTGMTDASGTRGVQSDESRQRAADLREKDAGTATEDIAARIGGLIEQVNWDYAVVERISRADLHVSLIPFNLGNVFTDPNGPDNIQLQPGDTVTIFSQHDVAVPMSKRPVFVRIEGEVKVPGVYQMTASDTLQTLLAKAGGPTTNAYLFGAGFFREAVRREQQANLEKAAARLEAQMRSAQSKSIANVTDPAAVAAAEARRAAEMQIGNEAIARFRQLKPTGRIAFGLDPADTSFSRLPQLKLENGDRLVIPSKPAFVHVLGAVNVEASPLWHPNSRVKDYVKLAGATVDADLDNVFVMRVDGTVVSRETGTWLFGGIGGLEVMPGDSIVIPEKFDKETAWTKFTQGTREWAQIFANFGLGAAAIQTLRK